MLEQPSARRESNIFPPPGLRLHPDDALTDKRAYVSHNQQYLPSIAHRQELPLVSGRNRGSQQYVAPNCKVLLLAYSPYGTQTQVSYEQPKVSAIAHPPNNQPPILPRFQKMEQYVAQRD